MLCGEYAVLSGAPAIVVAMNRRATSEIETIDSDTCHFTSRGFEGRSQHKLSALLNETHPSAQDPAYLCWHVLNQLNKCHRLPKELPAFRVTTDSRNLFFNSNKLGLGSSAAICTGLSAALMLMASRGSVEQPSRKDIFEVALCAHRASQNAHGSGLDIAASTYGGAISFSRSNNQTMTTAINLPDNMHYAIFNTGQASDTSTYLGHFSSWRNNADTRSLDQLCDTAFGFRETLLGSPANWPFAMQQYIEALQSFDTSAKQGIYTENHTLLNTLALRQRILYKPCGAGGGDLGIAMSTQSEDIIDFVQAAQKAGFQSIDLEIDTNGVHTTTI